MTWKMCFVQSVCMTSRSVDMMRQTALSGSIVSLNILKSMENSLTEGNKEHLRILVEKRDTNYQIIMSR